MGYNTRVKANNILSKNAIWTLAKGNLKRANFICEMRLIKPPPGDSNKCWAPETEFFDSLGKA